MPVELSLRDEVIVVVGAGGGGIGSSTCPLLAEAGADVLAITIDAHHGAEAAAIVEAAGRRASVQVADIGDFGGLRNAIDAGATDLGPVGGVVNVVGGAPPEHWHRLLEYPIESFDHLLTTNLRYVLVSCQHVARLIVESESGGGAMVNISSVASRGQALLAGYAAAKAGLEVLTRTMAAEWGRHGIRVNAVAPSTVNTPRSGRTDTIDDYSAAIPAGRRGLPADIAAATVFLLSPMAAYISGQTLVVDGGAGARGAGLDDNDLPFGVTNPAIRARFDDHHHG